jgi:hypothetical protein
MMIHNSVRISEIKLNSDQILLEKQSSKQNFDQDVVVDV